MPKVKRSRKPPPDGWELIEPTLDELEGKMKEGEENKMVIIISQHRTTALTLHLLTQSKANDCAVVLCIPVSS